MTISRKALCLAFAFFMLMQPATAQRSSAQSDYTAMLETRLQALEQQLARMTGQIEQAQYQARQAQDRVKRLEEDMNTRFRMVEQNQNSGGNADAAPSPRAAAPSGDERTLGQLTGGDAPADQSGNPAQAYDQAFRLVRDGDYEAAESAMRAFLTRWPKHELASNASYWLSETFYVRGDFRTAAKSFAETYQKYPKGSKAEDTLLKLGLSLSTLDRDANACTAFDQLEAEFPQMSPTTRRRMTQEREKLTCTGAN